MLLAIVLAVLSQYVWGGALELLRVFVYCHALWGLGQLLPVLPFRAGAAIAHRLRHGPRVAHAALSLLLVSGLGALGSNSTWGSALFPIWALATLACGHPLLEAYFATCEDQTGAVVIARHAEDHLFQDDTQRAVELAQQGIALARSTRLRIRLHRALAWGAIGKHNPILAHQAMERLPSSAIDLHLVAAYLSCWNRLDEAVKLLEEARLQGHRTPETTKLFIDVLFRSGKASAAFSLARAERQLLSPEDWRTIEAAVGERPA